MTPDDPDALLCSGDSGLNACGGCQELPDAPGDNCTGCAWSPCVFYCDGQEGLSCGPEGFIRLPPGEFTMGSPQGRFGGGGSLEEQRVTNLTRAFYMQITPVTQRQWRSLMGNNPSCFQSSSPTWDFFDDGCDDTSNANPEAPVESVSWWEAASYANALSAAEGLEECYNLTCSGVPGVDLDCSEVSVNAPGGSPYECTGYRLPTEAEWEYAARGGTTEETYNGDLTSLDCEDATLPPIAWSSCNSDNHTHPVALKQPNQRGLYDILGNVREWVWDYFSGAYGRSATDPYGATTGSYRVLRGGSWWDATEDTRAGYRALAAPSNHEAIFGFRLVRTSPL